MGRPRRNSTDHAAPAGLRGWPLSDVPPHSIDELCRHHGITARGGRRLELLAERITDPQRLRAHLAGLSAFELVILETLADHGGSSRVDWLWAEACRRVGIDRALHRCEIYRGVDPIGCRLETRGGDEISALFDVCVEPLRGLVSGVSLPSAPKRPPPAAEDEARRLRDAIIAAARTVHRRVKQNKDGNANRANRRTFEADVVSATDSAWQALDLAIDGGLVDADPSGALAPVAARLREVAARGFFSRRGMADEVALARRLDGDVVGLEVFVRADQRQRARDGASRAGLLAIEPGGAPTFHRIRHELSNLVGVWVGEVDGVEIAAVARTRGRGGGHVLPNFEVMLQPDADLELVRVVALAAEAVRLDRLCTFRLTPAAVRGALRSGATLEEIEGALQSVGPREIPDNVLRSLRDWAGQVRPGRIVRGRVIVVDATVAETLLADAELGDGLEALAPGVLRVAEKVSDRQLHARLDDLGVTVAAEPAPASDARRPLRSAIADLEPFCPDERLDDEARARVAAAMAASDFPLLVHDDDDVQSSDYEAPPGVDQDAFVAAVARVQDELRRWHGKLKVHARRKLPLPSLLEDEVVPMLAVVAAEARARIYKRSTKLGQLRRHAGAAMTAGLLAQLADAPADPSGLELAFPEMAPVEVRRALAFAMEDETVVQLRLRRGGQEETTPPLVIERVEPRGRELVVLAEDEAGQSYAYPLTKVASVRAANETAGSPPDRAGLLALLDSLAGPFGRQR
jgi:hypothetical protein